MRCAANRLLCGRFEAANFGPVFGLPETGPLDGFAKQLITDTE